MEFTGLRSEFQRYTSLEIRPTLAYCTFRIQLLHSRIHDIKPQTKAYRVRVIRPLCFIFRSLARELQIGERAGNLLAAGRAALASVVLKAVTDVCGAVVTGSVAEIGCITQTLDLLIESVECANRCGLNLEPIRLEAESIFLKAEKRASP